MFKPYVILDNLDSEQIQKWNRYYENNYNDWDRKVEEGIWRRTQEFENKDESMWKSKHDKRRRIVHYHNKYNMIDDNLVLEHLYQFMHICYPESETNEFYDKLVDYLDKYNWKRENEFTDDRGQVQIYKKRGIEYIVIQRDNHPEDIRHNRTFPRNYKMLEMIIQTENNPLDEKIKYKPWPVLATGIRKRDVRQDPFEDKNLKKIPKYFPAQIELGCGASIEAGIPPLNFLHEVYCVSDLKKHTFIFDIQRDELPFRIIEDIDKELELRSHMYKKMFLAKPTRFYKLLKLMHDDGFIVGDIITNNFDGIPLSMGLNEKFIRKYEETKLIPEINFHPDAKSLIVVGSHADRRLVRRAARKAGLKIIYIDPEGYESDKGFIQYCLEDPKDEDIIYHKGANEAFEEIYNKLKSKRV